MTTGEKAAVAIVSVVVLGGVAGLVIWSTSTADGGRPKEPGADNPFLGEGIAGGSRGAGKTPAPAGRFGPIASSIAFGGRISNGPGPNSLPPSMLVPPPKPTHPAGPLGV